MNVHVPGQAVEVGFFRDVGILLYLADSVTQGLCVVYIYHCGARGICMHWWVFYVQVYDSAIVVSLLLLLILSERVNLLEVDLISVTSTEVLLQVF